MFSVTPSDSDLLWTVMLHGPPRSPYKGGLFKLVCSFSTDFPFKPPSIVFSTKIMHPNVDEQGNICLGLLKVDEWKPSLGMADVLVAIYALLETPNLDDPLRPELVEQIRSDPAKFEKAAKDFTKKHASN